MAATAKGILPDPNGTGQKARQPMSNQHEAKLAAALAKWRMIHLRNNARRIAQAESQDGQAAPRGG